MAISDDEEKKQEQEETSLEDILAQENFKFQIIFQGTPQARTTSVSSAGLKPVGKKIWDVKLEAIRESGKLPKAYLFSINGTNTVADSTDLGHYISLTKENITALQRAAPGASAILTVQYTSKYRPPPTEIPKPPTLPTAPTDDGGLPDIKDKDKTPEAVNIDTTGRVASGEISSTHPAEMTDKEWNDVMVTNSLLHGMFLDTTTHTFQKARYPAFKLKDSMPVPAIDVNDDSSITITEVKSTYEHSMVQHGFNSSSVEASASGGFGCFSGGASASASWSSSHSEAKSNAGNMDCLHASYNFPRVKVFLDSDDLEITQDCKRLLDAIKKDTIPDDVVRFYRKYGHVFAGSVQLGGRLQTTKESKANKEMSTEEKKDALKAAAAASISTPYASGSVSASHGSGEEKNSTNRSGKGSDSVAWEAQGGETLLASNPPAWIASVGTFHNWRVMERGSVRDMLMLLKDISKEDWPSIFGIVEKGHVTRDPMVFTTTNADIRIENDTDKAVRVAVSDESYLSEPPAFYEIGSKDSRPWTETGDQYVFINQVDSNRVAIAKAKPGSYKIGHLPPNDDKCTYYEASAGYIGVRNTTASSIYVKVTTRNVANLSRRFFQVQPGTVEQWRRNCSETIFVMHSSSAALLTYFGRPGFDLVIGEPTYSSSHNFQLVNTSASGFVGSLKNLFGADVKPVHDVTASSSGETKPIEESVLKAIAESVAKDAANASAIRIFNAQSNGINAMVSNVTHDDQNIFYTVEAHSQRGSLRKGPEVIFVNGLHGTAVGAYIGVPGTTLIVNHAVSYDGK